MKAIPTFYDGIQFRSRLEARWAAFFNLLGWQYEYEPFDLNGWIPDFKVGGLLIEVKPVETFPASIASEIDRSKFPDNYDPMIVGYRIPIPDTNRIETSDGYAIGWMKGKPMSWKAKECSPCWDLAICQMFSDSTIDDCGEFLTLPNTWGIYHSQDHKFHSDPGYLPPDWQLTTFAHDRINDRTELEFWGATDCIDIPIKGEDRGQIPGDHRLKCKLKSLWNQAQNQTQWKSPVQP